jgi:lipoyl(octanoyl) transferase
MPFRYWNEGAAPGEYHMAVDRVLLRRMEQGLSEPYLRVYTWQPACLTLGYFQTPEVEFDGKALSSLGWNWAMRPTGGRAVLHAHEFTYSIAAPVTFAPWCGSRDRSYAVIGQALQNLLRKVGVETDLARGDSLEGARPVGPSRPCFASTSKLEVTLRGKKLVGSAQRRLRHSFLQHGSMPLDESFLDLVRVLPLAEPDRQAFRQEMQTHAASLQAFRPSFDSLAQCAFQAFSEVLGLECVPMGLTQEEREEIAAEWASNPHGIRSAREAEAALP